MCLSIEQENTEKFKKKYKDKKYVRLWKVIKNDNESWFEKYKYRIGKNKARGKLKELPHLVYGGAFHIFLKRKDARDWKLENEKIVRVKCFLKDLVAIGNDNQEACFTKLTIESFRSN